jgi:CheY-like chemotaxis protein
MSAQEPVAAVKKEVLLVDDDDFVRLSLKTKLLRMGFNVTTANSAIEAVAVLERSSAFDLVLTDVIMPGGMSGADLVREIQKRWPHIKTLMSSGYTQSAVLGKVQMPPDVKLLTKPYSNADLTNAIRETLDKPDSPANV